MAAVITGSAVVWGCGNFRVAGTGVVCGLGEGEPQSWDGNRSANVIDFKDSEGETVGRAFAAKKKTINIQVLPSDRIGTQVQATAKANLALFLIPAGTTVTIADADVVADPDAGTVWEAQSGKYRLVTSKVSRTNNNAAIIDMTLEQYDDYDVTVATT